MRRSEGSFASGIAEGGRAREAVIFVRPTFVEKWELQEESPCFLQIKVNLMVQKFILWLDLSQEAHPSHRSKLPIQKERYTDTIPALNCDAIGAAVDLPRFQIRHETPPPSPK